MRSHISRHFFSLPIETFIKFSANLSQRCFILLLHAIIILGRASWPRLHIHHTQAIKFCDNSYNYGNAVGNYNKTVFKSDEKSQIMRWISPLAPDIRRHGVRTDQFEGFGDWLLEISEFQECSGGEGGSHKVILFCPGNPRGESHIPGKLPDILKKGNIANGKKCYGSRCLKCTPKSL